MLLRRAVQDHDCLMAKIWQRETWNQNKLNSTCFGIFEYFWYWSHMLDAARMRFCIPPRFMIRRQPPCTWLRTPCASEFLGSKLVMQSCTKKCHKKTFKCFPMSVSYWTNKQGFIFTLRKLQKHIMDITSGWQTCIYQPLTPDASQIGESGWKTSKIINQKSTQRNPQKIAMCGQTAINSSLLIPNRLQNRSSACGDPAKLGQGSPLGRFSRHFLQPKWLTVFMTDFKTTSTWNSKKPRSRIQGVLFCFYVSFIDFSTLGRI